MEHTYFFTTPLLSQYTFTGTNMGTPINLQLILYSIALSQVILIATDSDPKTNWLSCILSFVKWYDQIIIYEQKYTSMWPRSHHISGMFVVKNSVMITILTSGSGILGGFYSNMSL